MTRVDPSGGAVSLPLIGQPKERADAARNRRALLSAARRILAAEGIRGLSMERVAAEAGVGVGTVYRRFEDRGGLALALLDHSEREFQAGFLSGPPPLGPGAPAPARIRAFGCAYLDRLDAEADLVLVAEQRDPTARHDVGAYRTARAHLRALLAEVPGVLDPDYLADALLALLATGTFVHQRRVRGFPLARIKAGFDDALGRLVGGSPSTPQLGHRLGHAAVRPELRVPLGGGEQCADQ